jgi:hypothetical protein
MRDSPPHENNKAIVGLNRMLPPPNLPNQRPCTINGQTRKQHNFPSQKPVFHFLKACPSVLGKSLCDLPGQAAQDKNIYINLLVDKDRTQILSFSPQDWNRIQSRFTALE